MDVKLKLSLVNDRGEGFMGIGLVWLLKNIDECRSISGAARIMKLSYVKALRIVNRLEKNLGRKVVNRTRGGDRRGGTELTPFGRRFLEAYERYQAEVDRAARDGFDRFLRSGWDREIRPEPHLRPED